MRSMDEAIHAFDPLLRELLLRGLVSEVPGDNGPMWQLTPEVQRRLNEVVVARVFPPADRLVYLGRHCVLCGARALTRLREAGYVCEDCARTTADGPPPTPLPTREDVEEDVGWRRHLRRKSGGSQGTSLAS